MRNTEIKNIVLQFAEKLKKENYSFSEIYLFGSYANEKAKKWSDIDVAVVSDKLKRNYQSNYSLLWKLRREIDIRIEPHGFSVKDFEDLNNPMVYEIRTTGIRIK